MGQAAYRQEAQLGQMMGMFNDIISGKAEMSQVAGFLSGLDGSFWKGAIVGAAMALLVSSPAITEGIGGIFSGLMGRGGQNESSVPEKGKEE